MIAIGEKKVVRQECPAIADWLNDIKTAFDIEAVAVERNGQVIFRRGELLVIR